METLARGVDGLSVCAHQHSHSISRWISSTNTSVSEHLCSRVVSIREPMESAQMLALLTQQRALVPAPPDSLCPTLTEDRHQHADHVTSRSQGNAILCCFKRGVISLGPCHLRDRDPPSWGKQPHREGREPWSQAVRPGQKLGPAPHSLTYVQTLLGSGSLPYKWGITVAPSLHSVRLIEEISHVRDSARPPTWRDLSPHWLLCPSC